MKRQIQLIASLALGAAMLAGCEQQPEARPAPNNNNNTNAPSSTRPPTTNAPKQDVQDRAQSLIDRAKQQISAGQFDAADTTITELETMQGQLPQDVQQQVSQLRMNLNNAKQAENPAKPGATPGTNPPPSSPPPAPSTPPPSSPPPSAPEGGM